MNEKLTKAQELLKELQQENEDLERNIDILKRCQEARQPKEEDTDCQFRSLRHMS